MIIEKFFYKHQVIASVTAFIAGLVIFVIGLLDVLLAKYVPDPVIDFTSKMGNWTYWCLVVGGFTVLVFGWYLIARHRKVKEINELLDTPSKSKFRKNIARIEVLALSLGPKYEDIVTEKEKEFNIKR